MLIQIGRWMKESDVWHKFQTAVASCKDGGYILQRIETGSTVLGFPDVILLENGKTTFIELKYIQRNSNKPKIAAEQVNMLTLLTELGFPTWLLIYKQSKKRGQGLFYVVHGKDVEVVKEHGIYATDKLGVFSPGSIESRRDMLEYMGIIEPIDSVD